GRVINYSYDNINRETGETWLVSGSTVNTLTFSYDPNGNELTAANSAGTNTMAYDSINHMTAIQEPFGFSLTYSYDGVGNRTLVQDSLSGVLTSVYRGGAATKIEMENGVRSGNDRWFLKTSINTREQTPCLQLHPNPPFLASTRTRSRECCLASIA